MWRDAGERESLTIFSLQASVGATARAEERNRLGLGARCRLATGLAIFVLDASHLVFLRGAAPRGWPAPMIACLLVIRRGRCVSMSAAALDPARATVLGFGSTLSAKLAFDAG
jgi:hypothetical protein